MNDELSPPDYLDDAPEDGVLEIPFRALSAEALDGVLADFVSREGTDYGDYSYSFDDKKQQVLAQLQRGDAVLLFDPVAQNCHIELKRTLRQQGWQA